MPLKNISVIPLLHFALWRLRRYGMVVLDDDAHFLLTNLGRKSCDKLLAGLTGTKRSDLENWMVSNVSPPPVQPDGAWVGEGGSSADLEQETVERIAKKLVSDCIKTYKAGVRSSQPL